MKTRTGGADDGGLAGAWNRPAIAVHPTLYVKVPARPFSAGEGPGFWVPVPDNAARYWQVCT
jgi:hypothetical protein